MTFPQFPSQNQEKTLRHEWAPTRVEYHRVDSMLLNYENNITMIPIVLLWATLGPRDTKWTLNDIELLGKAYQKVSPTATVAPRYRPKVLECFRERSSERLLP